jgi:ComF family protein
MDNEHGAKKLPPYYKFYNFAWSAIDWLFPPECPGCKKRTATFCDTCQTQIKEISGNLCKDCGIPIQAPHLKCENCRNNTGIPLIMRSWAVYDGVVRNSIIKLKFKQDLGLGHQLAKPLITLLNQTGWEIDLVVPIPLSKSHLKSRGYNQAALISYPISLAYGFQHSTSAILRIKETASQVRLQVEDRYQNMVGAFLGNPAKLKGKRILVVDDVITTGATMHNCVNAIRDAGAKEVFCISVARALKHFPVFS